MKLKWILLVIWIRRLLHLQRKFYVGDGGCDALDGRTWQTRKQTLAAIEELVRPGDTVYVFPPKITTPFIITKSGITK